VDRSGVLDSITDPVDDLSLVTGLPEDVVEAGLGRLLKSEVIQIEGDTLLIPNFIEAQEASKSDKQRQRESRERRRAKAKRGSSERQPSAPVVEPKPETTPKKAIKKKAPSKSGPVWDAYSHAYQLRYDADPVRNAKQNALCCQLVDRLGADTAPAVAAYYLTSSNGYYAQRGHALGILVADAEKVCTEWRTGQQITQTRAREQDRLAEAGDMWGRLIQEAEDG
jgi:hypothetical protein